MTKEEIQKINRELRCCERLALVYDDVIKNEYSQSSNEYELKIRFKNIVPLLAYAFAELFMSIHFFQEKYSNVDVEEILAWGDLKSFTNLKEIYFRFKRDCVERILIPSADKEEIAIALKKIAELEKMNICN